MTYTRLGIVLGAVALVAVGLVAALVNSPLRSPLIALAALVVLVAGGNYLNDYLGIKRKPQEFNQPDRQHDEDDAR